MKQKPARPSLRLVFKLSKNKFNLDEKKLIEFAQSLLDDGINPHEQDVDLVAEYRSRNFTHFLKKPKIEAEQQKQLG